MPITVLTPNPKQGDSFSFTATIKDAAGTVIPLANMTSLTLTYYNEDDQSIINSRDGQNVLNLNNCTYHATTGLLTWIGQPADTTVVNSRIEEEVHIGLFKWTTATESGSEEVQITIENLAKEGGEGTLTLVVEDGSGLVNANSYATLAEADLELLQLPDGYKTDWDAANNYVKERLLIWATRLLDEWVDWYGAKNTQTQALRFPRSGLVDPDDYVLASDEVPAFLKTATAFLGKELAADERTSEPAQGIDSLTVGPISIDFTGGTMPSKRVLPAAIRSIVAPYGRLKGGRRTSIDLVRG